jgi:hypothetical protein
MAFLTMEVLIPGGETVEARFPPGFSCIYGVRAHRIDEARTPARFPGRPKGENSTQGGGR